MDILNITEKKQIDEAVEEYEYHSFEHHRHKFEQSW